MRVARIGNGDGKAAPWYAACDPYTSWKMGQW